MRRRGHTLVELCISLALIVLVGMAITSLSLAVRNRHARESEYAQDLERTWRALEAVERDLRAAHDVTETIGSLRIAVGDGTVTWRREDDRLVRTGPDGDRVVARRIGTFDATRDGTATFVTIAPLSRRTGGAAPPVRTAVRDRVEDAR